MKNLSREKMISDIKELVEQGKTEDEICEIIGRIIIYDYLELVL